MQHLTGNQAAWLFIGIPAILAWFGAAVCWLLAPHLATDPQPLFWALCVAGGWYAIMILIFGGWMGLLLLASIG
ncbi:hypothetical protein FIV06_08970 [Labrenzia sp. THAF191b]|uniref:hypothetical protein n=1 Tax=unclassified Labrenzia TaxID=2648686 RepID=UPI001269473D|nr:MULTISPECIES: hypothetical protein [unclassified Labrenzia]QFS97551.1 hypothetical protein FIV06_08970 [Labrenzia sp. THAF191b]QFT03866.1 hypothetical protein FIV05_08970 [Labrenzia sp. THAF191a]QFT15408.1 hypothetical protein FIV03_08975 [Labrenzia sp. THAF187b]